MSDVDMGRMSVALPIETIRQIDQWAVAAGVKRGQFTSMAMVIGARTLARQTSPEAFMTPDAYRAIAEVLGVEPEDLQRRMAEQAKK
jgi:hypothetical protein